MLQQWAAIELLEAKPGNAILEKLLDQEADQWPAVLQEVRAGAGGRGRRGVDVQRLLWRQSQSVQRLLWRQRRQPLLS